MRFKNFLTILSLILFLLSPSIGLAGVMFEDNFDAETNEPWIYDYDSFANWNVTDGTVDLVSSRHPGFEALTDNGIFIDLDGTSNNAGTMRSKTLFEFKPGFVYELFFDLAGSQRPLDVGYNTVTVSLGSIYDEDFTLYTADPFQTFQHSFTVNASTKANLMFEHWGGDNGEGDCVGLLLDNVKITSTLETDTDGDGIPDDEDACPFSDLNETVVIDGCDSVVQNMLLDDGCTISDLISQCADDANNHGKFVSAVSHTTNTLKKEGIISGKDKGKIQKCAANADIP